MKRPCWKILVIDGITKEPLDAVLYQGMEEKNILDYENLWIGKLRAHNENLKRLGINVGFAEDAHWSWRRKMDCAEGQIGYRSFAIEVEGTTEALMMLRLIGNTSIIEASKDLVYIEYLAVAPDNRKTLRNPPKFASLGTLLVSVAVQVAFQEGMAGRVALHSLPGANSWYLKLGFKNLGQDLIHQNLCYFELSSQIAQQMLDNMND